jgi:ABC-type polysaccharide/polyol phosphate export permease
MVSHLAAIWQYRYFWMSLVKMDLMTRYRKSVLGIGWSLLQPLAMTAIFTMVFSQFVNDPNDPNAWKKYSVMTLTAMTVFGFLRDSMLHGCQALVRNEAYIRQCPLPFSIYPMRIVLGNAIHFAIAMALIVVLASVLLKNPLVIQHLWMVLPMFLAAMICAWSLATLSSFATVYFHDTAHILEILAQMVFFLTPIIYGRQYLKEDKQWIVNINPAAAYIEAFQQPLIENGTAASWNSYALALGFTALLFGAAVLSIRTLAKKIIFHL